MGEAALNTCSARLRPLMAKTCAQFMAQPCSAANEDLAWFYTRAERQSDHV